MHIVELQAENIKRLRAVRIRPAGNLVVIGGNNAQGKSSVLDAIAMALGGARSFPDVPVPGLGFDAHGLTLNGLPVGQASSAEQLRLAVALAASTRPTLRVMFVRDAAFLDQESLRLLGELAAATDFQVWLERVGTSDPQAIVIEDGEVKEGPAHG